MDVTLSPAFIENVIKNTLDKHKEEVIYSNDIEFGPWQLEPIADFMFPISEKPLYYSYKHVKPSGTIKIEIDRNDMSISHINYNDSFTDLYDFDYKNLGEIATDGAIVQLGYDIVGNPEGKIFRSKVEFESDSFEYNFN